MDSNTRNLVLKLSGHMAYMQDKLEEYHHADSLQDHYWYRESVALRQQVADALATKARAALAADEPAVPEGREPASVTGEPSDEELLKVAGQAAHIDDILDALEEGYPLELTPVDIVDICRAVVARYGRQPAPPAGELLKEAAWLRNECSAENADGNWISMSIDQALDLASLLERQAAPVPMAERLPAASHVYFEFVISDADDCTQAGGIAPTYAQALSEGQHYLAQYQQDGPHTLELRRVEVLPPGALPLPQGESQP